MSRGSLEKIGIALVGVIIFLLPYERIPSLDLFDSGFTVRLSQLFGVALWVLGLVTTNWKTLYSEIKQLPVFQKILGLYIFSSFLSVLVAAYDLRRAFIVWLFTTFTIGVGFWVSRFFYKEEIDEYKKYLATTTWIVVVFGIYQFAGDIIGFDTSVTGLRDLYTHSVLGFTRVQSVGLEPLYFASFLLIPLLVFVADCLMGNKSRLGLIFVSCITFTLTVSRGAYIGGLAALFVLFALVFFSNMRSSLLRGFKVLAVLILAVVTAFVMMSYLKPIQQNQSTPDQPTKEPSVAAVEQAINLDPQDDRIRNRRLAVQLYYMYPVLGVGPGNFDGYAREKTPEYRALPGYVIVNNQVLETLSETGVVGFLLLFGFVVSLILKAFIDLRKQKDPKLAGLEIGLVAFIFSLAVQYQTFSTLYIMHVWVAIGILMGCLRIAEEQNKPSSAAVKPKTKCNAKKA